MEEMLLKLLEELIDEECDNYIIADNIGFILERERALDAMHYYEQLRKNLRKKMRKQRRTV